jgi:hypothetical protein
MPAGKTSEAVELLLQKFLDRSAGIHSGCRGSLESASVGHLTAQHCRLQDAAHGESSQSLE